MTTAKQSPVPSRFRHWLLLLTSAVFLLGVLPYALWEKGVSTELAAGGAFWIGVATYAWQALRKNRPPHETKDVSAQQSQAEPHTGFGVAHLAILLVPIAAGAVGAAFVGTTEWGRAFAFLFCGGVAGVLFRFVFAMIYDGSSDSVVVTKQELPSFRSIGEERTAYSFSVQKGSAFVRNRYREAADAAMGLGGLMLLVWVGGVVLVFFQKITQ